jgi:hypothetical protein
MRSSDSPKNLALLTAILLPLLLVESAVLAAPAGSLVSDRTAPFRSITVRAQVTGPAALGPLEDYWDPSLGGRVELDTPFHAGTIRAGLHVLDHDALVSGVPDFTSAFFYMGWSYERPLGGALSIAGGLSTGGFYMRFKGEWVDDSRESETEIGFGLGSRVEYAFADGWAASLSGDYVVVLTSREVEYVFAGAGVSRSFAAPKWFTRFFE